MPTSESANGSLRDALDPIAAPSSFSTRLVDHANNIISIPFSSYKSTKVLSGLAPSLMTSKVINPATISSARRANGNSGSNATASSSNSLNFSTLGRAPGRLSLANRRLTSRDLEIAEATPDLLSTSIPTPPPADSDVSLLQGFQATIPSSDRGKLRRKKVRHVEAPPMGLKQMGLHARGLLADAPAETSTTTSGRAPKSRLRPRESLAASVRLGRGELERQLEEIHVDAEHVEVRRRLIRNELQEIENKIARLGELRQTLENDLLKLDEEDLELNDELEGVQHQLSLEQDAGGRASQAPPAVSAGRRRKGPAFLPSEHDDLPTGVAFMTLTAHHGPITALDFSEPYGTLVSSSSGDEGVGARVWDLASGEEIGHLSSAASSLDVVKCLQVEDSMCVTGTSDAQINLWDLRQVGLDVPSTLDLDDASAAKPSGLLNVLRGHTQAISTLYFEDSCLVSGASDKTIRQWDMSTGQCVMTMDILWAISHPPPLARPSHGSNPLASPVNAAFSVPTPPLSDGSWDLYEDFVGAVQFWGFALVSGSGDSALRMWDMRTGQAHRTLMGHTGPITCLQFDERHIVSGSLDKTIRIWDLRTGGITDTIRFEHPVSALQFDTRKVVAAAGENGIKVYNRTNMQQSSLMTNGHTLPSERLRYIDSYMVSGGRDACVKPNRLLWHFLRKPVPYLSGLQLQENLYHLQLHRRSLGQSYPDLLLLLEHRPVYTYGRRQLADEFKDERSRLEQLGAECITATRGGETTYHGPGQLVGYPLLDLRRASLPVKDYICALQNLLKSFAREHGVATVPSPHTGAFVSDSAKLGSIGVQVRHRLTTHGFSINITEEPIPWFDQVVACGLPGVQAVSLEGQSKHPHTVQGILPSLLAQSGKHLGMSLSPLSESDDAEVKQMVAEIESAAEEAGPWNTHPLRS